MHDGQINLNITAPKSWRELSQDELRYTLFLLTRFQEPLTVKTYLFCRLAGIEIIKHTRTGWKCSVLCRVDGKSRPKRKVIYLETEIVLSLLSQFDFIDGFDNFQPLQAISGLKAVTSIRKITFQDYLFAEKYYQLYLMHKEDKFLQQLGYLLYRDEDGKRDDSVNFTAEELLGTFLWYSDFKQVLQPISLTSSKTRRRAKSRPWRISPWAYVRRSEHSPMATSPSSRLSLRPTAGQH